MLQWLLSSKRRSPELLPGDKRTAPRYRFNYKGFVPLSVAVGTSSWPALVRDLSQTGISLVIGQRYDVGSDITARLKRKDRDQYCMLNLRVVHVARRADGHWTTGCIFDQPMHPDDLANFV